MKLLAIRFGDNDFARTFHTFLHVIDNVGINQYQCATYAQTKQKLVELCNLSLSGLYWLAQNRLNYSHGDGSIAEYLTIKENNIFIDDEVVKFLEANASTGDNGEFHVLDTTGHTGSIIYSF